MASITPLRVTRRSFQLAPMDSSARRSCKAGGHRFLCTLGLPDDPHSHSPTYLRAYCTSTANRRCYREIATRRSEIPLHRKKPEVERSGREWERERERSGHTHIWKMEIIQVKMCNFNTNSRPTSDTATAVKFSRIVVSVKFGICVWTLSSDFCKTFMESAVFMFTYVRWKIAILFGQVHGTHNK